MKQTMKRPSGSLVNWLMANNSSEPEVGKGATVMSYTDRHAFEVVEVSPDKRRVKLEHLSARWDPSQPGGMGHQNWILEPTGIYTTVVWRNHRGGGAWYTEIEEVCFTDQWIKDHPSCALATTLTEEQRKQVYGDDIRPQNVVEGITRKRKRYSMLRILFGRKDYYYDWSF